MLTIRTMPILLKIISKLDIKPIVEKLKELDIFEDAENAGEAIKQLSPEKVGILGAEIITEIAPQLGYIADDFPPFVAAYKGITTEEAYELDAAEVLNEIIFDKGIRDFFVTALRKKAAQGA